MRSYIIEHERLLIQKTENRYLTVLVASWGVNRCSKALSGVISRHDNPIAVFAGKRSNFGNITQYLIENFRKRVPQPPLRCSWKAIRVGIYSARGLRLDKGNGQVYQTRYLEQVSMNKCLGNGNLNRQFKTKSESNEVCTSGLISAKCHRHQFIFCQFRKAI